MVATPELAAGGARSHRVPPALLLIVGVLLTLAARDLPLVRNSLV